MHKIIKYLIAICAIPLAFGKMGLIYKTNIAKDAHKKKSTNINKSRHHVRNNFSELESQVARMISQ